MKNLIGYVLKLEYKPMGDFILHNLVRRSHAIYPDSLIKADTDIASEIAGFGLLPMFEPVYGKTVQYRDNKVILYKGIVLFVDSVSTIPIDLARNIKFIMDEVPEFGAITYNYKNWNRDSINRICELFEEEELA